MSVGPDTGGDTARDRRVGQVLNDFMDRRARGEDVSTADLLARHPELADDLRQHLRLVNDIRPAGDLIADLIARGILTACHDDDCAAI